MVNKIITQQIVWISLQIMMRDTEILQDKALIQYTHLGRSEILICICGSTIKVLKFQVWHILRNQFYIGDSYTYIYKPLSQIFKSVFWYKRVTYFIPIIIYWWNYTYIKKQISKILQSVSRCRSPICSGLLEKILTTVKILNLNLFLTLTSHKSWPWTYVIRSIHNQ